MYCLHCGNELPHRDHGRGRQPTHFCSRVCKLAFYQHDDDYDPPQGEMVIRLFQGPIEVFPTQSCPYPPGTEERLEWYAARALKKLSINQGGDSTWEAYLAHSAILTSRNELVK